MLPDPSPRTAARPEAVQRAARPGAAPSTAHGDAPRPSRRRIVGGVLAAAVAALGGGAGALAGAPPAAAAVSTRSSGLRLQTLTALNVRASASTTAARLGTLAEGAKVTATGTAGNGWFRITYNGRTGYISHLYVKAVELDDRPYVSTRRGIALSQRYFLKASGANLHYLPGGGLMVGDLYAGTVVWRDLEMEERYAKAKKDYWWFVRTAGMSGWIHTKHLRRTQPHTTRWTRTTTASQIRRMANGRLNSAYLVAIPWDPGMNLVAGPALADLTRMDAAFRRRFGRHLEIDLTYRTRGTQEYYYRDLGPYIAAKPGTSNHGWGLAVDFPESADYGFDGKYFAWLKANSWRWGFRHHDYLEEYTASGARNPYAEAWHFEYVRR